MMMNRRNNNDNGNRAEMQKEIKSHRVRMYERRDMLKFVGCPAIHIASFCSLSTRLKR